MLSEEQKKISIINSCGPFVHSNYQIHGQYFSQEGPLKGRAKFLLDEALETLRGMNNLDSKVLDIGAYDGFILNSIYMEGWKNLVGLEPRIENIERGRTLRDVLGIKDETRHFVGTLDNPGDFAEKNFDLTLCFGVIHHLNDISSFVADLRSTLKLGGTLLLETLVLSDNLMPSDFQNSLEAKDLIYKNSDVTTSFIGVKLESDYYPGSTVTSGTVQVPALQTLIWFLEFSGFEIHQILPGWEKSVPADSLETSHRNKANSVMIRAIAIEKKSLDSKVKKIVLETERNLTFGVLDKDLLNQLEKCVQAHPIAYNQDLKKSLAMLMENQSPIESEIISSIWHDPIPKLQFELAKFQVLCSEGKSIGTLIQLVENLNSDWRTTYRVFNLLTVYDLDNELFWKACAFRCNPEYPFQPNETRLFFLKN